MIHNGPRSIEPAAPWIQAKGLRGGARFADNGAVVLDLQQVRETSADEFVIVQ